jgi:hypothetical protein
MQHIAAPAHPRAAGRHAIPARLSVPFRAVATLLGMAALFSSVALIVASAVGDILVGLMASLVAFTASAPVLGPVLGADNKGSRA